MRRSENCLAGGSVGSLEYKDVGRVDVRQDSDPAARECRKRFQPRMSLLTLEIFLTSMLRR